MMYDYDALFITGLFPKEIEESIIAYSIGSVQHAANNFQWSLVRGFDENLSKPIKLVNAIFLGSFPLRYRKLFIPEFKFSHGLKLDNQDINVGFSNLMVYKFYSRYISTKRHVIRWACVRGDSKLLLAYALTLSNIMIIRKVKKKYPNVITCIIVPDLPEYMNLSTKKKIIYSFFKRIEIFFIKKNLEYVDNFVLLTKYMADALAIKKPFSIIEGISTDVSDFSSFKHNSSQSRYVLYSGSLDKKYGVKHLVDSFLLTSNNDTLLYICGFGELEEYVKKIEITTNRVKFLGLLKKNEVLGLQKNASILINPRSSEEKYTRYSFPSKMLEYMSSGTPVLSYKLEGIPDEYDQYYYKIFDEEGGLAKSIDYLLSLPENDLREKGTQAMRFVTCNKNAKSQVIRILTMISQGRKSEDY